MVDRFRRWNALSAIFFLISSLSLLYIPFISDLEELPKSAYVVAAVFWLGLILGTVIQFFLFSQCKKRKLSSRERIHRIPLCIAAIAFLVLSLLILFKSRSSLTVILALVAAILSLQASVVIKRKECLK
jgi:threonine/homoserine/homoserine lactone efflux protein